LEENFTRQISELSSDKELMLEKNIIWIFGNRGEGIRRFSTKLLSHKTHVMDEPKIGYHLNTISNMNGHSISFLEDQQKKAREKKPKYDYFFFYGFQKIWKFYLRKLILNRINAQFPQTTKKIIIKEADCNAPNILSDLLPNSKIIVLFQDGSNFVKKELDFITKHRSSGISTIPLSASKNFSMVEELSNQWNDITEIMIKAYENHNENLRLSIKIEDLEKNTFEILEKIYKFAEIDIKKEQLQKLIEAYGFEKNQKERNTWKCSVTDEEEKIMDKIMLKKLHKLGYRSLD